MVNIDSQKNLQSNNRYLFRVYALKRDVEPIVKDKSC